jgi:hypothetical protein
MIQAKPASAATQACVLQDLYPKELAELYTLQGFVNSVFR